MKCKGLIFDMDGTLLDTIGDIASCMDVVLASLGLAGHDTDTYKRFVGDGIETLVLRALPENMRNNDMVQKCVEALQGEYKAHCLDKTRPYKGIEQLLDVLAEKGMKLAILSNKPDGFTKMIKNALLGRWKFEAVMGQGPNVPKKPDPSGALMIAERMGYTPNEICFIGDTGIDMQTAISAGMIPIGVSWGFRGPDELIAAGARRIIEHPLDLLEYTD